MRKQVLVMLGIACAVAQIGATQARSHYIPRTERGRLAEQIVLRWSAEAARRHDTTPRGWAEAMGSAFARAPIEQLRQAAAATTFDQLHESFQAADLATAVTEDLVFRRLPPCRIVNTRLIGSTGDKLLRNTTRTFKGQISSTSTATFTQQGGHESKCGIPDEAVALALQVLAARPEGDGHLTVFPEGTIVPMASSLNYRPLQNISNELPMGLGTAAEGRTFNVFTNVNTHFVADVVGYYVAAPEPQPDPAPYPQLVCRDTASLFKSVPDGDFLEVVAAPACREGEFQLSVFCNLNADEQNGRSYAELKGNVPDRCIFGDADPDDGKAGGGYAISRCCSVAQ